MNQSETIDALWVALDVPKPDDTAKLALADALEERADKDSNDLATAAVLRWCVQWKRWPKLRVCRWRSPRHAWFWGGTSEYVVWDTTANKPSRVPAGYGNGLPQVVLKRLRHNDKHYGSLTIREAVKALVYAFEIFNTFPRWSQ